MMIRKKYRVFAIHISIFLILYYGLILIFGIWSFYPDKSINLNNRLGTILFHSVIETEGAPLKQDLVAHIYCYYPKAHLVGGENEYLLKKVESLEDCQNWFGMLIRYEYSWMDESQMFEQLIIDSTLTLS